jgi:hypothetical protein
MPPGKKNDVIVRAPWKHERDQMPPGGCGPRDPRSAEKLLIFAGFVLRADLSG